MPNANKIDKIINKINKCWRKVPNWRFGQILFVLENKANIPGKNIYYMEEDEWEIFIDLLTEEIKK